MSKFRNNYNIDKPVSSGEVFREESETDSLGYRSISQMVDDFLEAGVKLNELRRGEYDFSPDHIDDVDFSQVSVPDIRKPGLDLVDLTDIADSAVRYEQAVKDIMDSDEVVEHKVDKTGKVRKRKLKTKDVSEEPKKAPETVQEPAQKD